MTSTFVGIDLLPEGDEIKSVMEIVKENGLKNYTITATGGSSHGENYLGNILAIDITGEDENGAHQEVHIILKSSPRTGIMRMFVPANQVYIYETKMYSEYLPLIYDLQEKCSIQDGFSPVAHLYKYSTTDMDEFIILENMKKKGYDHGNNRRFTLDVEHCVVVLKQLAVLHGLGFALKHIEPEKFKAIADQIQDHVMGINQNEMGQAEYKKHMDYMCEKAIKTIDPETEKDIHEKLMNFKEYSFDYFLRELSEAKVFDEKYTVVVHGDCWNNNILFKYNDSNKPVDVCFLDWQIARVAPPVLDLSYFMYMCTNDTILNNHFDELMQIYHQKLTEILTQCGLNANDIYPYSIFQEQIKKYFGYGVLFAIAALPMFVSESDEIPEMQKIDTIDENMMQAFQYESKNHDLYVKRIRAVILHAFANNYI